MSGPRRARRSFQALLVVLLVVDVAAAVVLLSPAVGAGTARFVEAERLRQQGKEEARRAAPAKDIDQKIVEVRAQVAEFERTRLPARDSAIAEELGRLVADSGVRFSNIRYAADEQEIAGLRRMQIDASLAGDYVKVVKFINALERDKMFFLVSSVALAEQQGGTVRLELKLETYMRKPGTTPAAAGAGEKPKEATAPRGGKHS